MPTYVSDVFVDFTVQTAETPVIPVAEYLAATLANGRSLGLTASWGAGAFRPRDAPHGHRPRNVYRIPLHLELPAPAWQPAKETVLAVLAAADATVIDLHRTPRASVATPVVAKHLTVRLEVKEMPASPKVARGAVSAAERVGQSR